MFAKNQSLREPLRKALIALALSEQRVGDPAAMKAAFAELLHSFPDAVVSRGVYGSDAFRRSTRSNARSWPPAKAS